MLEKWAKEEGVSVASVYILDEYYFLSRLAQFSNFYRGLRVLVELERFCNYNIKDRK